MVWTDLAWFARPQHGVSWVLQVIWRCYGGVLSCQKPSMPPPVVSISVHLHITSINTLQYNNIHTSNMMTNFPQVICSICMVVWRNLALFARPQDGGSWVWQVVLWSCYGVILSCQEPSIPPPVISIRVHLHMTNHLHTTANCLHTISKLLV